MGSKKHQKPEPIEWDGSGSDALEPVAGQAEQYVLYLLSHDEKLPSCGEDLCKLMLKDGSIVLTGKWGAKPAMKKKMAMSFGAHLESVLQGTRLEYDAKAAGPTAGQPSAARPSTGAAAAGSGGGGGSLATAGASPAPAGGRKRPQRISASTAITAIKEEHPPSSKRQRRSTAAVAPLPMTWDDSDEDFEDAQHAVAPAAAAAGGGGKGKTAAAKKPSGGGRGVDRSRNGREPRSAGDLPCLPSPRKRPVLLSTAAAEAAAPEEEDDEEEDDEEDEEAAAAAAAAAVPQGGSSLSNVDQHVSEDLAPAAAAPSDGQQQRNGYDFPESDSTQPPSPPPPQSPAAAAAAAAVATNDREGEHWYSPEPLDHKQQQQQQQQQQEEGKVKAAKHKPKASKGGPATATAAAAAAAAAGGGGVAVKPSRTGLTAAAATAAPEDADSASQITWQWQRVHLISNFQRLLALHKGKDPEAGMPQQDLISGVLAVPGLAESRDEVEQFLDWMISQRLVVIDDADGTCQFATTLRVADPVWLSATGTEGAGSSKANGGHQLKPQTRVAHSETDHHIDGLDDRALWKCAEQVIKLVGLQCRAPSQLRQPQSEGTSRRWLQFAQKSLDVAVVQYCVCTCLGYNKALLSKGLDVCRALDLIDVRVDLDGAMQCRLKL